MTVTLPTAPNPGDVVRVSGSGSGGWKIAQNVSQSVVGKNISAGTIDHWIPSDTNRAWMAVASSSDGSKLVATDNAPGRIYTSTDSGGSWTPRDSARTWYSVASSSDGSKLVAVDNAPGRIYTSTDSGVTWVPRDSNRPWQPVASSPDGSKLVAAVYGGQIYNSTDSGVTWTPRQSNRNWVAMAATDGNKLVAVVEGGQIYTASGTAGYLLGDPDSAVELQYIGNGQFVPLSHEGTIIAY